MYRSLVNRSHIDANDEEIRLNLRNQSTTQADFIYYTLQPGDTLHNISVRFSCPVALIKRFNNLWSDQDFYGFTRLKLPVGKFRLITDLIQPNTLTEATTSQSRFFNLDQSTKYHASLGQIPEQVGEISNYQNDTEFELINSAQGGDQIFKAVDSSIETARKAAQSYKDHASDIMQSLAQGGNLIVSDEEIELDARQLAQQEAETLLNDLTDYGLSYNGLILFVFIVCLICPLAYVIYLEETQHHDSIKHHTDPSRHD